MRSIISLSCVSSVFASLTSFVTLWTLGEEFCHYSLLLILMYINNLTANIYSNMKRFADNPSVFACVADVTDTHEKLK